MVNDTAKIALLVLTVLFIAYNIHRESMNDPINNGRKVTLHFTTWCGYCKAMKPTWAAVRSQLAGRGITFAENDEDKRQTPGVDKYPTIRMVGERGETHTYPGGNDADKLKNWILNVAQ